MSGSSERRALRGLFYAGGVVATLAGLDTALRGARSLPQDYLANAVVESELRFYAPFYSAYGVALLRMAARADRDPAAARALAAPLFAAGLARAAGWRAAGTPHPLQRALLAAELTLPPLVLGWQRRLARMPRP